MPATPFQKSLRKRRQRTTRFETLERRYVLDSTVVFNELMYHPQDNSTAGEWMEIHNQMSVDIDLSDWSVEGGVRFDFPAATIIPGGGYLIVAADPSRLASEGIAGVLGPFTGSLSNSGERIELRNNSDRLMDELDFRDSGRWPVGPDGSGATLAKAIALAASPDSRNWKSSSGIGGTPGQVNFATRDELSEEIELVNSNSSVSIHIPTDNGLQNNWTATDFVEGNVGETWIAGTNGVGFDDGTEPISGEVYRDAVLSDQPLGYWPLDDTAQDLAGGHHGTATAGVNFGSSSLLPADPQGSSVRTIGSERVTVSGFEKFPAGSAGFSVEYWITIQSTPSTFHNIVGDGESGGDFYLMNYLTDSRRIRPHYSFANSPVSTDSNTVLQVGQAYHVVTTWNQSNGEATIYIDGELDKSITVSTNIPSNTDNTIFIGKDNREPGGDFLLDEVAIYNYALSEERIVAHAIAGGIDTDISYTPLINTDIEQAMQDANSSAYVRASFNYQGGFDLHSMTLSLNYDDGFVAYLNGTEVARRNAPASVTFNSNASQVQPKTQAIAAEAFDLTAFLGTLTEGTNVLAIHGLNIDSSNGDFLLLPELDVIGVPSTVSIPELAFSEITATTDANFWIEIRNDSTEPIEVDGNIISSRGQVSADYTLPAMILAGGDYLVIDENQLGFRPATGDRLFFLDATGDLLFDARVADSRLRGRSLQHMQQSPSLWLYPAAATPTTDNQFAFTNDIVINEIMYNPRTGEPEWLELLNNGTAPVELANWQLRNAVSYTFPAAASIGSGEYLVVTSDVASLSLAYPNIEIAGPYTGQLNNDTDVIELIDSSGNPADIVEYFDAGRWAYEANGHGSSLELIHADSDNDAPEVWRASDTSNNAQWQAYTYRGLATNGTSEPTLYNELLLGLLAAGEVLIDDIQVVEDPNGAARSLIQNGDFESDGLGAEPDHWRVIGNQHGEVIADPTQVGNQVLHLTASGSTEHKHNNAGTTLKAGTTFVSINPNLEYEISFRAKWLAGGNKLHSRLYFNRVANISELALPTNGGTPGSQNSTAETSAGATFRNLHHSPISPNSNQIVTVSVAVESPSPLTSATVNYSVDGGPAQLASMTAVANVYSADIPPQTAGSTVQFFVSTVNADGVSNNYPAAGLDSRALFRFGADLEHDKLQTIQILTTSSDQATLSQWTNLMSNESVGATVVYNQEVFYDVDLRVKGSQRGRTDINRRGFRLEFSPEQKFRGVHSTIGLDRSGGWRFGRTFGQDEIAIHQFINRAGSIPSLLNDLVFLDAPGVSTGSAQLQLARFDDHFLDGQFQNGSAGSLHNYELIYFPTTTVGDIEGLKNPNPDGVLGFPLQDLGNDVEAYRWHFENRNNRLEDDYSGIIRLNELFGLTGNAFLEQANDVLDVDQWLRTFAATALGGVNDSYFNNSNLHNARFYTRPEDGKVLVFPWDMDFAFHISATAGITNSPDLNRLLGSPHNYHMYLGHLDDIMNTSFNATYMQHWTDHFEDLLNQGFPSILSYIQTRESHVRSTISNTVSPLAFNVSTLDQTVDTNVVTLDGDGWVNVREIRLPGSTQPLNVKWTALNRWEADLSVPFGETEFTLEAYDFRGNLIASDIVTISSTSTDNRINDSLRITEVMYNPSDPTATETLAGFNNNDDFEFIELRNIGSAIINLAGVQLVDAVTYTFGNVTLNPGDFIVVAEDLAAFQQRYGIAINAVGQWNGGLNNTSDTVTLLDPQSAVIQQFTYADSGSWPSRADGRGSSLEVIDASGDVTTSENWRSSVEFNGTPGAVGIGDAGSVVINEVLSHTDFPQVDAVELFNPTVGDIEIGGWYLSDSGSDFLKFRIPDNTTILAGEYLIFTEADFNPTPSTPAANHFAFSSAHGDTVWLVETDDDNEILHFIDSASFAAQANGESWGRWPNGEGRLYPMTAVSLLAENPGPRVGPIVISEVHYNPVDPDGIGPITSAALEFVEVYNPTNSVVTLTNWGIAGGVTFSFPVAQSIAAGEAIVIVSFDPTLPESAALLSEFSANYSLTPQTTIIGGYTGQLENAGETVRLTRPDQPPVDEPLFVPALLEDEVRYDDQSPWPAADGTGDSLTRNAALTWGNASVSWYASGPTPG
ncbi:MAG: hypothetical protein ACI9HK_002658, partial [Pirellulaceae bacterium]